MALETIEMDNNLSECDTVATTRTSRGKAKDIGKIGSVYYFATTLILEKIPTKVYICKSTTKSPGDIFRNNIRTPHNKVYILDERILPDQFERMVKKEEKLTAIRLDMLNDIWKYGQDSFKTKIIPNSKYTQLFEDDTMDQKEKHRILSRNAKDHMDWVILKYKEMHPDIVVYNDLDLINDCQAQNDQPLGIRITPNDNSKNLQGIIDKLTNKMQNFELQTKESIHDLTQQLVAKNDELLQYQEKITQLETELKKYKSNETKCAKLTKENKELENENKKLIQNSNQQLVESQEKIAILETELKKYKQNVTSKSRGKHTDQSTQPQINKPEPIKKVKEQQEDQPAFVSRRAKAREQQQQQDQQGGGDKQQQKHMNIPTISQIYDDAELE